MVKKALVFLADGFEEVEAITPVDYLRRAGVEVWCVSINGNLMVAGAHGVSVIADAVLEDGGGFSTAVGWDAVIVPGGMPGAANLAACPTVEVFFREMAKEGKLIAAICASPALVLGPLGLLNGKNYTCYPGMEDERSGGFPRAGAVVIDGALITSRGPGTAAAFAFALVEQLAGPAEAAKLATAALL